jgi:hypothetical protein
MDIACMICFLTFQGINLIKVCYGTPNESRKMAFEEQMLHSFKRVTRATFHIAMPILFARLYNLVNVTPL